MLNDKLTKKILHTTDNYIKALEKAWINTIYDFLCHFPREYEDRTNVLDTFSLINIKEKNTILVTLVSINTQKTANNKVLSKAIIEDKSGFLAEAVWFNRKYLATQLSKYTWWKILISWKVKYAFWKVSFMSPDTETDLNKVQWEIVPIYSDLNYIPSKWTAPKIDLLKTYFRDIKETLPETIVKKYNFISRKEAFYKIHFPKNNHDIEIAQKRLAYEELFDINYRAISNKYEWFKISEWKALPIKMNPELIKEIITHLPFSLTNAQKIVLFQTLKDMEKPHSMARLLEWDVWTGKTIVALISAIHGIIESGEKTSPSIPPLTGEGSNNSDSKKSTVWQNYWESPEYVINLSRELRKKWTKAEWILWSVIRWKKLNWLKFRRQHPFWRYIADFYCSGGKLVIELDWEIHKNTKEYDKIRDEIITKYWVTILRVKNDEIYNNIENILQKIIDNLSPERGEYPKGERGSIQVAIMAPTEILARQHFASMKSLLLKYNITNELLVWSTTKKQKNQIKEDLKTWNLDLIIWTHALVQDDVLFKNLWYVIIDEQHRFWVKQREVLESWLWNSSWVIPHVLNMTATPIPRTLALTLYWDQDLSVISEYPKWRKEIYTKVAKNEEARRQIELFIRTELDKWRQVFWISPLVEESEKMDLANAISTYESLTDIFSPFTVWLLHWKMKAKEKAEIMNDFNENKIQVLSSTSVVEVWVDVPNSTIMCIEWAERFWLSQLHQFRWRVGRWKYQSYCYLFPTTWNNTDRLRAMEGTNNGFELSEIDLELRWPWEVYGVKQSWLPDLKIADLKDLELISQIREDIIEMFEK